MRLSLIFFIIIATGLAGEPTSGTEKELPPPLPEPSYSVPDGARDPFFPPQMPEEDHPQATDTEVVEVIQEPTRQDDLPLGVVIEDVIERLSVSAVFGAESGGGVAVVGGKLREVGTAFKVRIGKEAVEVMVVNLRPDQGQVDFRCGSRRFTLRVGTAHKQGGTE